MKGFLSLGKLLLGVLVVYIIFQVSQSRLGIKSLALEKFNQYFTRSVCDTPLHYKLGTVDPKFNLSEDNFLSDIKEATQIWDQAEGKKIFAYDPGNQTALSINLVFDTRQALSNQIGQLQTQVQQQNQTITPKLDQYNQQSVDFQKKLADFDAKAADLNKQIDYWNSHGGAPPDEYSKLTQEQDDLKKEQASLQQEADTLNQMARDLNLSTQNYNADVGKLNTTIESFDTALSQKPEEGLFDPSLNKIDIYFDINQAELIHTLAHELGHAWGLNHNQNKFSIMYPFSTKVTTPSKDDINSFNEICSQRIFSFQLPQELIQKIPQR